MQQVDPNHINAQRELAHTLMLHERYEIAERHFEALLKIDQNEHMRDDYRAFLRRIDQNKPRRISGHFSFLPSTNVNRGTTHSVFDTTRGLFVINPESQAESGIGIQFGLSGHFRRLVNPQSRISLNWGITEKQYEQEVFNSSTKSVAISYEKLTNKGDWFISPYHRITRRKDDGDNDATGLHWGLSRRLDLKNQLIFSVKHEYIHFFNNRSYKDGPFSAFSASLNHQVNPGFAISGGVGFEQSGPEASHLQYDAHKLFSSLVKKWKGGLQTKFGVELGKRNFSGVVEIFEVIE